MIKKLASWILLIILLTSLSIGAVQAQTTTSSDAQIMAQAMLNTMTPEEEVGQLFLVTFSGTDVGDKSQIYDLIVNHNVGGVILQSSNNNFTDEGTVPNAYQLVAQLQTDEWYASQKQQSDTTTGKSYTPPYIPLFAGIQQNGDGSSNDQIFNGITTLPDEMAIGATWNTSNATQVGKVMGSELSAMGFNFFIGPSLDVAESTQTTASNNLGAQVFGGDPFWVGEMGKAYITGIHQGSNNHMAVISSHFPGSGSADRSPEDEVATVRETLDQLKADDLAPFFAVTGNAPSDDATTDGLLVSHIRYEGFQGNIRETTKPVSFDAAALSQIMSLDALSSWRSKGGILVSDDLGSRAVRRFYDPTGAAFNAHTVALNAFLAGNDLLYTGNFVATGDSDSYTTIVSTLDFFAQKYREDSSFKQKVDASVMRILTLKYKLYPEFKLTSVVPQESGLNSIDSSQQVSFNVAQNGVTLISPTTAELESLLPNPPQLADKIIFFTDALTYKQCTTCKDRDALAVNGLENAVLKLYGPQVSGQVLQGNLSSYSFANLQSYLNGSTTDTATMIKDLTNANWVIFSTLALDSSRPETYALRNLLSSRPDLLQNKKVVVFAFNAPYDLDATDISKLTAYYGLYSKSASFLDVAARVLFHELTPKGSLPVSVTGAGYDVIEATSPDPMQTIPLYLGAANQPAPTVQLSATPNPTVVTGYSIGDTINFETGVIYDYNQNPVPDGTSVQFSLTYSGDNSGVQLLNATTKAGIAQASYHVTKSGQLSITVASNAAKKSETVTLSIPGGITPGVTIIVPTQKPSITPSFTMVPTATKVPTSINTYTRSNRPYLGEWFLALFIIALGSAMAFVVSYWVVNSLRWGMRWGLCTMLAGLFVYLYISLGLPGAVSLVEKMGTGGILEFTLLGIILGWLAGFIWWFRAQQDVKQDVTTTK